MVAAFAACTRTVVDAAELAIDVAYQRRTASGVCRCNVALIWRHLLYRMVGTARHVLLALYALLLLPANGDTAARLTTARFALARATLAVVSNSWLLLRLCVTSSCSAERDAALLALADGACGWFMVYVAFVLHLRERCVARSAHRCTCAGHHNWLARDACWSFLY